MITSKKIFSECLEENYKSDFKDSTILFLKPCSYRDSYHSWCQRHFALCLSFYCRLLVYSSRVQSFRYNELYSLILTIGQVI